MATTLRDMDDWQIINIDENGNSIDDRLSRRNRKRGAIKYTYLQRISDGLSFGKGENLIMQDEVTGTYSVFLIHEIRQNTLNNVIEIWAYSYLRWFELKPLLYYKQFNPAIFETVKSLEEYRTLLLNDIDKNEIYLTAELSEIWLKDFIGLANIVSHNAFYKIKRKVDSTFFVRHICEPTAENFIKIDIFKEMGKIKRMYPKESDQRLKRLSTQKVSHPAIEDKKPIPQLSKSNSVELIMENDSRLSSKNSSISEDKSFSSQKSTLPANLNGRSRYQLKIELPKAPSSTGNIKGTAPNSVKIAQKSVEQVSKPVSPINKTSEEGHSIEHMIPKPIEKSKILFIINDKNKEISKIEGINNPTINSLSHADESKAESVKIQNGNIATGKLKVSNPSADIYDNEEYADSNIVNIAKKRRASQPLNGAEKIQKGNMFIQADTSNKSSNISTTLKVTSIPQEYDRIATATATAKELSESNLNQCIKEFDYRDLHLRTLGLIRKKYNNMISKYQIIIENNDNDIVARILDEDVETDGESSIDVAGIEGTIRSSEYMRNDPLGTIHANIQCKKISNENRNEEIAKLIEKNKSLIGKSTEFINMYLDVFQAILYSTSKALYISGERDCGKMEFVKQVLDELKKSSKSKELTVFKIIEVDGLNISDNETVYTKVWRQLSDETLTSNAAKESLMYYFSNVKEDKKRYIVIILNNLDTLLSKGNDDILFNFFNWTTLQHSKLTTIALAQNTELPESYIGKIVSSQLNISRYTFEDYTTEQLVNIFSSMSSHFNKELIFAKINTTNDQCQTYHEKLPSDKSKRKTVVNRLVIDGYTMVPLFIKGATAKSCGSKMVLKSNNVSKLPYIYKKVIEIIQEDFKKQYDITQSFPTKFEVKAEYIMSAIEDSANLESISKISELSLISRLFLAALLNCASKLQKPLIEVANIYKEMAVLLNNNPTSSFSIKIQEVFGSNNFDNDSILQIINWCALLKALAEQRIIDIKEDTHGRVTHTSIATNINIIKSGLGLELNQ